MITKVLLFMGLLALSAAPLAAHEVQSGPNGGRIVEGGNYHFELVTRGDTVEVFLTDMADKPVPVTGYRGAAILVVDGRSQRIPLEPAADRLAGRAATPLPARPRGAVQLTAPDGRTAQARFN
jgi:hypothetical protein